MSFHLGIVFVDGGQLPLAVYVADVEEQVQDDGDEPAEVDPAGYLREHLQLHARRLLPPDELVQPEHRRRAVVQQPRQEDQDGVEREAHLPTRHHLVYAVVEQPDHVEYGHEGGADAGDHGAVVDEVQERQVLVVAAGVLGEYGLGAVGDDQHAEVVHLRGDAEGVDESLNGTFVFGHMIL